MVSIQSDSRPNDWAVSLGSVLRSGMGALVIPIQRVLIHPAFNGTNMDHDVALLELSAPAPVSYTIQPVCLPSPVHLFLEDSECYITGWGSMKEGGESRRKHHIFLTGFSVSYFYVTVTHSSKLNIKIMSACATKCGFKIVI